MTQKHDGGPDLTSQEQVNRSIGMCRLHGLHNTEATLRALLEERDALKQSLEKAVLSCGEQARARGEAEGRLAASEMAGVVDGWKARAEAAEARVKELEDDRDDAISVLDAWFDRRKLAHEAVDDVVLGAVRGYLRTSRSGGMEQDQSDVVEAVISDMARLSVFADLFARAALPAAKPRCAECDCERGGSECNWIAPGTGDDNG